MPGIVCCQIFAVDIHHFVSNLNDVFALSDATMSQPVKLRVILEVHGIRKLDLPQEVPGTVNELECVVRETFGINQRFSLHCKDLDFGEGYFTLTSTDDIKDTIKVVHIVDSPVITLIFTDVCSSTPNCLATSIHESETAGSFWNDTSSVGSQDTLILSSPEHTAQRSQVWPTEFPVPRFAYNTGLVLASGNETYKRNGVLFNFTAVLPDILEKLAECIFQYVAYP